MWIRKVGTNRIADCLLSEGGKAKPHLTNDQRSYIRGRRFNRTKKAASGRSDRNFGDAQVAPLNTAKALAEQHGVSERTIKSDGKKADRLSAVFLWLLMIIFA